MIDMPTGRRWIYLLPFYLLITLFFAMYQVLLVEAEQTACPENPLGFFNDPTAKTTGQK